MQMLFWRKNVEDEHCLSPGLFAALYLELPELSSISYVNPMENIFPFSHGLGQKAHYTPRCENRKFDTKTKFKKQTNADP
jgi:hypothetical protein